MQQQDSPTDAPAPDEAARPDPAPPLPDPVAAPSAPAPRRSGGLAALAGGALAAVFGFALAQVDAFGLRAPAFDDAPLRAALTAAEGKVAAQEAELARVSAAAAAAEKAASAASGPVADLAARIAALETQVAGLETALAAAATASPDGAVTPAALAALTAALEELKAKVAALGTSPADPDAIRALAREELAAWEAEAAARLAADRQAAADAAARAAAVAALQQALVTGAPYADALAALSPEDVPETVSAHAEKGLPTLTILTSTFPDAARAALDAGLRAESGGGLAEGFWAFLRLQTGARSLTPQEGDGTDAILSRAEAAVKAADLTTALAELATLTPESQEAMAPWVALAQDHLAAAEAIAALAAAPISTP